MSDLWMIWLSSGVSAAWLGMSPRLVFCLFFKGRLLMFNLLLLFQSFLHDQQLPLWIKYLTWAVTTLKLAMAGQCICKHDPKKTLVFHIAYCK